MQMQLYNPLSMRFSDKGSSYLKIMPFIAFLVQTVGVRKKEVIVIIMQIDITKKFI